MKNYSKITEPKDITTKQYVDEGLKDKLDKSGGTLTGNLTGQSITATRLQSTSMSRLQSTPNKYPVFDENGWICYRNQNEIAEDIGAATTEYVDKAVENSSIMYATFSIDPVTGMLIMSYKEKYSGPDFRLNNGILEVIINA